MKRFGIFIFYDKYGTVNKYVKYLLEQMRSVLLECCVVCNGYVTDSGKEWFKTNSDYVFIRENEGYDAGAYQDVILNKLGLDKLREFDELVLLNNSFYGPIYSFESMFEDMEKKKSDFWGITAYKYKNVPYHIQSYFLVIRENLLKSVVFEEYWRTQKKCNVFTDAVKNFELKITDFFMKRGFTCCTYIDFFEIKQEYDIEGNLLSAANYELLVEKRCPIVKRKYIMSHLNYGLRQSTEDIISFIKERTDYNVAMIWEDLIQEYSPFEITSYRNLNHYLADSVNTITVSQKLENMCIVIDSTQPEQFINHFEKQSCKVPIIVYTDKKLSGNNNITVIKKSRHSFLKFIIYVRNLKRNSDYFCFLNDSLISRGKITEKRRNYNICRQLASSTYYMIEVQRIFEQQPYLGVLFSEEFFDEEFFFQGFYKHYLSEEKAELLNKVGCHVTEGEQIINHSGCFWMRAAILDIIEKSDIINEDISKQEFYEIFPYLVKIAGFYSGMLNNIDVITREYMWKNILLNDLMNEVVFFEEDSIQRQILEENILKFIKRFRNIYIYGVGKYAKRLILFLERKKINIKGLIVTFKNTESSFKGYKIIEIHELMLNEEEGIIVAMAKINQNEVKKELRGYPEKNIYYI